MVKLTDVIVEHFSDHIIVANDGDSFSAEISKLLVHPGAVEPRRDRVRKHTWTSKANQVREALDVH